MTALATRSCPVCAAAEAEPLLEKGELKLVRCRKCQMVYASPVAEEFLGGAFYEKAGNEYYLTPAKLAGDYAPVRFQRELRFFRRFCDSGEVLDVGCSTGGFLFQLGRHFPNAYRTLGMDASGPALEYAASQGVSVVRGDFLEHDFGPQRFDAITFWAVLEHLDRPRDFLKKAARLLKPSGVCLVLVPNFNSLATRLLRERYRYIYPQHLNYFTPRSLERLAVGHFAVIQRVCMHFNPLVIWQDWRGSGAEVPNESRAKLLTRTTAYKQNPLLAPARVLYRCAESTLGAFWLADNLAFALRPLPSPSSSRQ